MYIFPGDFVAFLLLLLLFDERRILCDYDHLMNMKEIEMITGRLCTIFSCCVFFPIAKNKFLVAIVAQNEEIEKEKRFVYIRMNLTM